MENLPPNIVFAPMQAAVLTEAYEEAINNLDAYHIDQQIKAKLATMILAIGRSRINAGGELATHEDALSVASIASQRLVTLRAG